MTPAARSLQLLRQEGYLAEVVERWLPHAWRRVDLFGFADLLAVHARDRRFLLVQTTSDSNLSKRVAKVHSCPGAALWLQAGGRIECHGWRKRGGKWAARRVAVSAEDLAPTVGEGQS
jgi:hypothetical protein